MNPDRTRWDHRQTHWFPRLAFLGCLVVLATQVAACASTSLHPAYKPIAPPPSALPRSITPVTFRVLDTIQNDVPLPEQLSAAEQTGRFVVGTFLGGPLIGAALSARRFTKGDLVICDTCPYRLDEPPAAMFSRLFADAMKARGLTVAAGEAARGIELDVKRFAFIWDEAKTTVRIHSEILVRATVREGSADKYDEFLFEGNNYNLGSYATPGDFERAAADSVSRLCERILMSPGVVDALGRRDFP